jgi:hypothetical protein
MTDQFGKAGRRAALARLLHDTLVDQGLAPLDGSARPLIDLRVAEVAADLGVSEAVALRGFRDEDVVVLARSTAAEWHAAAAAEDAAGSIDVQVPAASAAQLVMGLAMAVGQLIREVYGDLPASVGQPLDALCELGSFLRHAAEPGAPMAANSLQTLAIAHRALESAAQGVADGERLRHCYGARPSTVRSAALRGRAAREGPPTVILAAHRSEVAGSKSCHRCK